MADINNPQSTETVNIALVIGKIDSRLSVIENIVGRLDKTFLDTGSPYRILENKVEEHLREDRKEKEKKDKFSNRVWAVVLCIIAAVATQTAALIFLFLKSGIVK